jgi:hypothetical protein
MHVSRSRACVDARSSTIRCEIPKEGSDEGDPCFSRTSVEANQVVHGAPKNDESDFSRDAPRFE